MHWRITVEAQAQWADETTIIRSKVNAALKRGKTDEPIVGLSDLLCHFVFIF